MFRLPGDGDPDRTRGRAFQTESGLAGAYVERHTPYDEQSPLMATLIATYAIEIPVGFVVLSSSTFDLAGFEAFRPHFEALARTVRWED